MRKFISFSTSLLCALTATNLIAKSVSANHTDSGFYICNSTRVSHSFTMVDIDYSKRKNFSLKPNECWEYWEYEQIEFIDNFNNLKRYSLQENYRYRFQYDRNGAIDVVKEPNRH